jgi:hypothetical protein
VGAGYLEILPIVLGHAITPVHDAIVLDVAQRLGSIPAAYVLTDLLQRSVETFIHMQEEFLKIAGKQTHVWIEAPKVGKPYHPEHVVDLAREGLETFVKAQKHFLDVIVDETARATGSKKGEVKKLKKAELADLARHATDSFIEAQKKLVDIAGKQMNANVKTAGKTMELLKPFPFLPLAELTPRRREEYVDAQRALMDAVVKPKRPNTSIRANRPGVREDRHPAPIRRRQQLPDRLRWAYHPERSMACARCGPYEVGGNLGVGTVHRVTEEHPLRMRSFARVNQHAIILREAGAPRTSPDAFDFAIASLREVMAPPGTILKLTTVIIPSRRRT